jgi:hypothetical protein
MRDPELADAVFQGLAMFDNSVMDPADTVIEAPLGPEPDEKSIEEQQRAAN